MKFFPHIFILVLVLACEEVAQKPEFPGFIGTWKLTDAHLDGYTKPGWEGHVFTFSPISDTTGTYQLSEIFDDSTMIVWNKVGTWEYQEGYSTNTLIRDGEVQVALHQNDDKLNLRFYLPGYPCDYCCTYDTVFTDSMTYRVDTICILTFPGAWQFDLERSEAE